jgi:hypothetical protein
MVVYDEAAGFQKTALVAVTVADPPRLVPLLIVGSNWPVTDNKVRVSSDSICSDRPMPGRLRFGKADVFLPRVGRLLP